MATISYSTLANGASVTFNAKTDVLWFDTTTLSAADLTISAFGANGTTISTATRTFTLLGATPDQLSANNVKLANGSLLATSTADNHYAGNLSGGSGNDLMVGTAAMRPAALVSTAWNGAEGNGNSFSNSLSGSGRWGVFTSDANNLTPTGDANYVTDVYLKDLDSQSVTLISTSSAGYSGLYYSNSFTHAVSEDGSLVVFTSYSNNLVSDDTNPSTDIFLKNTLTGQTTLISRQGLNGAVGNAGSNSASISGDGRYVAFASDSTNLVSPTTTAGQIYLKNIATGQVTLVSKASDGTGGNGFSFDPILSQDGSVVLFSSDAANLDSNPNTWTDVFITKTATGLVTQVSTASDGTPGNYYSYAQDISSDGRHVLFTSEATNLVPDDTNGDADFFVKDTLTGAVTRVNTTSDGSQIQVWSIYDGAISGDGRFVVFSMTSSDQIIGDSAIYSNVFLKDLQTGALVCLSVNAAGDTANSSSFSASLSGDGRYITFTSYATDLAAGSSSSFLSNVYVVPNPLKSTTLSGGTGNDTYVIDHPLDVVSEAAGGGTDTVRASISYTLPAQVENLVLSGSASTNATGNNLANLISGNAGDNVIDGGTGIDTVSYARATDSVNVDLGLTDLQDTGSAGLDTLRNIENLTGSPFDDVLLGNDQANVIDGGAGADLMAGGLGSDTYVVAQSGDEVIEDAGAGTDTVRSSISLVLPANVEDLVLTGTARLNATGNALNNVLTGNGNTNVLDGGAGTDTASYGTASAAVTVGLDRSGLQSTGGGGIDSLISIENLTGSNYSDTLHGNAGTNVLNGGAGIDTLSYARATGAVTVSLAVTTAQATGGGGTDTVLNIERLIGSAYADNLAGSTFTDTIDGGAGNDTMTGGAGNDTYIVANSGDTITELTNGGTDTVLSSITYALPAEVENLTLTGAAAINATGNLLANTLVGNSGSNILNGGAGTDTVSYAATIGAVTASLATGTATSVDGTDTLVLIENLTGSSYNDTLTGNSGSNVLNGGTGADSMIGGDGSDTYYVDATGDVVTETNATASTGGTDQVYSSLAAYTLPANVEYGRVMLTTGATLTGNALANTLMAGSGNDVLDGSTGTDTASYQYAGAAVNVSLAVTTAQATGGSGTDTLVSIENLTGSNYNDTLTGDGNANLINGGTGNDLLTGGLGADTFRFASTLGPTNIDTLADFAPVDDTIQLENANFTALTTTGTLAAASFVSGAGVTAALDANDYILYDTTTGALYYDADGSGAVSAPVRFATVTAGTALTNADFVVT